MTPASDAVAPAASPFEADARERRMGALLGPACLLLAAALPPAALYAWTTLDPQARLARAGLDPALADPPSAAWAAAAALAVVPALVAAAALWSAARAFRFMAAGRSLSAAAVAALSAFGARTAAAAGVGILCPALISLVLSIGAAQGALSIMISSEAALGLVFGGAVWALARAMGRAAALAEDHAEII